MMFLQDVLKFYARPWDCESGACHFYLTSKLSFLGDVYVALQVTTLRHDMVPLYLKVRQHIAFLRVIFDLTQVKFSTKRLTLFSLSAA